MSRVLPSGPLGWRELSVSFTLAELVFMEDQSQARRSVRDLRQGNGPRQLRYPSMCFIVLSSSVSL